MVKAVTQDDLHSALNTLEVSLTEKLTKSITESVTASLTVKINEVVTENTLRIFQYFDRRFEAIDERFAEQDKKFDGLYGLVDSYAKQVEIYHHEMLARDHQFSRMEGWIRLIAEKVDVQLEY